MNQQSEPSHYGIGVDTGGTYTDAVLVDLNTLAVVQSAKRPSTHHDLSIGISEALAEVTRNVNVNEIKQIAFSTTLATNAIVEGKGASVGLVVIGHVKSFDLPVVSIRYIKGGHSFTGEEVDQLDIEALVDAINEWKGEMDAYAITSAMSFKNPTHEQVAEEAIKMLDSKPTFCSHRISSKPGMMERAGTAVLHARLMPVISSFVDNLKTFSKKDLNAAKHTMIGGDAEPINFDEAIIRAANTVGSGPAATSWFGAKATDKQSALVVDVGGTSTDVALILNGEPLLSSDGSTIGNWNTHVNAVEMETSGIGGDSLVQIDKDGRILVGPERVQPIATSTGIPNPESWLGKEIRSKCLMAPGNVSENETEENEILQYLRKNGPTSPAELVAQLSMSEFTLERKTRELVFQRQILESGFTPTDALHALGQLDLGDSGIAKKAAQVLAAACNQDTNDFCEEVLRLARIKIKNAVLKTVFRKQTGKSLENFFTSDSNDPLLSVSFSLNVPIIGIGAAARLLLPEVSEMLGTEVIFPEHYEVGNALGAIMIASK